jgi:hypothetical protein
MATAPEQDNFDAYEEKLDELNEGLLEAYAAGFSQAVETFEVDADFSTDVTSLQQNGAVQESHYYYWDGRTKPLKFWLREQFGVDASDTEGGGE